MPGTDVRLRRASFEEAIGRGRVIFPEWGGGLTLEQFLGRERKFREHAWGSGALATWFLEDSKGRCLSSCETFRVESEWRGKQAFSYGFASVYTEAEYRGKGYAKTLLPLVEKETQARDPALHAFYLFSDIGSPYYESLGYEAPNEAWDRVFEPEAGDPFAEARPCDLAQALQGIRWPESPFRLIPGAGLLDWQLERERVYANSLGITRPRAQGAMRGNSRLVWSVNYKKDELFALLFVADNATDATALVTAARRMAGSLGLKRFRAWEEHENFTWPAGGMREERDGSLPMVKPALPWQWVPRGAWI